MTDTISQEKDQQNKASCPTQLIEHPRVVGLAVGRTGTLVLTVNTLNKDGAKCRPRLWALPAGRQGAPYPLTAPELGASVLTVTDEGHIYLSLSKDVDEADPKSLKGVYRLPEHGEPDLVFTHPGGVDALTVRQCGEITRYIYNAKAHCGSSRRAQDYLPVRTEGAL